MSSPVLATTPLGFAWETSDPFLFCVHHDDAYPVGNERLGPAASLAGRNLGMDFEGRDGWRMYHGEVVPGFPSHPHRGFETVTIVRRGYIDHSDSLGAAARYGEGDVQWLTAGAGIQHAEMFPLLSRTRPNPVELFQIWLNLPAADKMAPPHFSMLWGPRQPRFSTTDAQGRRTDVTVIAGALAGHTPPPPPPRSWASRPEAHVAIWTLKLDPGASFTLPAAVPGLNRTAFVFRGGPVRMGGAAIGPRTGARLRSEVAVPLDNGDAFTEILVLQGRPIGEPVAAHGPFVMNTQSELQQAYADYRRTRFGGWPWPSADPTHGPSPAGQPVDRFARDPSGAVSRAS